MNSFIQRLDEMATLNKIADIQEYERKREEFAEKRRLEKEKAQSKALDQAWKIIFFLKGQPQDSPTQKALNRLGDLIEILGGYA